MKTETLTLKSGATLKTYIWDDSDELRIVNRPAVLVFPGGAYAMCSDREAEPIALAYAAEGYNSFVLRYTVREGFEPPFADAQEALGLIRKNASHWRVIPDKIAVCGFSAGGHLAVALGALANDKPNALVLGYPSVKAVDWLKIHIKMPELADSISKDTPPCFIFASFNDPEVPIDNSIVLMDALNKSGVPFESHIFMGGGHGGSLGKKLCSSGDAEMENPILAQWFKMSVDWLKITLGDFQHKVKTLDEVSPALLIPINDILKNEKLKAVVVKYIPTITSTQMQEMAGGTPLYPILNYLGIAGEVLSQMTAEMENVLNV